MKKRDINQLIDRWLTGGAITVEQAEHMKADVNEYTSEKSGEKFISVIMYIGAIALSLGVLLLIASNWAYLPKVIKLILALLLPVVPISFAYWQLVVRASDKVLGRAANILGLVLVGGSLSLIGQIYNLEANMLSFFWLWAVLTTPFIFVFKKTENVLFGTVIIGIALGYTVFEFLAEADIASETAIILFTIAGLLYAYILYAIGIALRHISNWLESGRILRLGGAALGGAVLFITTFDFYAQIIVGYSYRDPGNWQILSLTLNLLFIGFLVFALIRSIKYEEYSFAFGIVRLFGFYLLIKYFTLFYSMLDTGIFFLVGGALFIAGGWILEKKKSVLVSYMKGSFDHTSQMHE